MRLATNFHHKTLLQSGKRYAALVKYPIAFTLFDDESNDTVTPFPTVIVAIESTRPHASDVIEDVALYLNEKYETLPLKLEWKVQRLAQKGPHHVRILCDGKVVTGAYRNIVGATAVMQEVIHYLEKEL